MQSAYGGPNRGGYVLITSPSLLPNALDDDDGDGVARDRWLALDVFVLGLSFVGS
jgi:hypothetical protein